MFALALGYEDINDHDLLVDLFLDMHETLPERIVLDVDATDDQLHGQQEGRFYHGYYRHYCYLPVEYLRSFGLFGLWQLWQSSDPGGRSTWPRIGVGSMWT